MTQRAELSAICYELPPEVSTESNDCQSGHADFVMRPAIPAKQSVDLCSLILSRTGRMPKPEHLPSAHFWTAHLKGKQR
jgi:hypothetical protein